MANIKVRRANVVLTVPDYQQNEYLAKGFDIIGADGKVLVKTTPNDLNSLKRAYTELTARVKELEAENAQLKAELSEKPTKPEKAEKVEEPEEEYEEIPTEEPRKRRRKQQ